MSRTSTVKTVIRVSLVLAVLKFGLIQQTQMHLTSMVHAWHSIHERAVGA